MFLAFLCVSTEIVTVFFSVSKRLHSKVACTDTKEYVKTDYDYRVVVLTIRRRDVNANSAPEVLIPCHPLRLIARTEESQEIYKKK